MSGLSRRYAEALYGPFTDEKALRGTAAALMSLPPVWEVLTSPAISAKEKKAVLSRLPGLGNDPVLLRFLGLLAEKGRMALLPQVVEDFHALGLERRGAAECVVTCVRPLDAQRQASLKAALCKLHHKSEVTLTLRMDPGLLGGFVLEMDGVTYDRSVRGGLKELARRLEEECAI